MKRVVIVGGGITGLSLAHALEKAEEPCSVRVVEGSLHLGGNMQTVRHNGYVIDAAPDGWVSNKPHATRLAREVGLGDELIGTRPDTRKVYIVWKKELHPLPEGLVLGVPTEWRPLAESTLLGVDSKARAFLELLVPKKDLAGDRDESVGAFIARRLGADIAERIAEPLLGGVFGGDADSLSIKACVPQFVEAEAKYGSLALAMRALRDAQKKQAAGGERETSAFTSLKRGVGDLVVNVAHRLRDAEVTTGDPAAEVARLPDGDVRGRWGVRTAKGETIFADDVALTVPAYAAAKVLATVDPALVSMLGDVAYASTATVFLAYRKFDVRHPLDAVGFLVPKSEGRPILACTFVSSKWDHRAPAGQVLLRVVVGGASQDHVLQRTDEELVQMAREQLRDLLGIDRSPMFTKVFRWAKASAQPTVGHLARMRAVLDRVGTHPGLHVGGGGYVGTGIADAVKQGEEIAERIEALRRSRATIT